MPPHPTRPRRALVAMSGILLLALFTAAGYSRSDADTGEPTSSLTASSSPTPQVPAPSNAPIAPVPRNKQPNIILISTDDETVSDMRWMPKTRRLLGDQGVTFTRALSPHPLCCPARAAILTGQYAQNNHVKSNKDPFNFKSLDVHTTLPVWMHRAGYRTAFTGKYLNGYGTKGRPQPGWDYWDATMINPYSYEGYQMFRNGDPKWFAKLNNVDYINRRMLQLVDDWSDGPKPFFIWASQVAPHGRLDKVKDIPSTAEALPPRRFKNAFSGAQSPSIADPAFNEADVSGKNALVRSKSTPSKQRINEIFRSRIRSLQAVDEGVEDVVQLLARKGELDNTWILFTSDNGFLLGEHRLVTKNVPYRQSIRVPLYVRGPGAPAGAVRDSRALMIDVAPTIAALGGAQPLVTVDGVSLLPAIRSGAALRETVLIQAGPQLPGDLAYGWWWRGVATDRYTYARFFAEGLEELYDHKSDPSELDNIADDPRYADVLAELRRRTETLVTCTSGAQCSQSFGPVPEPSAS